MPMAARLAGLPVVSTPIVDVIRSYGESGLVRIAGTPEEFVQQVEGSLRGSRRGWRGKVDARLARDSWEATWRAMMNEITASPFGLRAGNRG
jgi:hypothetical protein